MALFGTDDVIYVPEGQPLVFDDVYHWKRFKIDVRRMGVRMKSDTFDEVSGKIRSALDLCRHSPRFEDSIDQIAENSDQMIRDMARISGGIQESLFGSVKDFFRSDQASWWVRLGDLPAESFFEEDYEREAKADSEATPFPTYGRAHIAQLDSLDLELPGTEEDGLPFALDVPRQDGLTRWTIPPTEPLPLVREYCGVRGASAFGRTVNLNTHGVVEEGHQFCTPLGRVGEKLFVTLYFYYGSQKNAEVSGVVPEEALPHCVDLLGKSKFEISGSGPTWRIFERDGDVVHLYSGLAGKEAEGVETMPSFLLVASAGGQFDPQLRSELYEAIKETI